MFYKKEKFNGDEYIITEEDLTIAGRSAAGLMTDHNRYLTNLQNKLFTTHFQKDNKLVMTRSQFDKYISNAVEGALDKVDLAALIKKKTEEMILIVIGRLQGKVF